MAIRRTYSVGGAGKEGGIIQNLKSKIASRHSAEGHAGRKRVIQNPKSKIQNCPTLIGNEGMGDEVRQGQRRCRGGDWLASAGSSGQFSIIHLTE